MKFGVDGFRLKDIEKIVTPRMDIAFENKRGVTAIL